MHQVKGANPFALTIFLSLWCSPVNMPASHAGDHRSEAGQGHQSLTALKALSAMHSLCKRISRVQLRVRDPFLAVRKDRSRASAQVGFISPPCPGRHRRLRPFLHHVSQDCAVSVSAIKASRRGRKRRMINHRSLSVVAHQYFASLQQPADRFCKAILPEHHRVEAPDFIFGRVVKRE